jgi:hypothetical protein
MQKDDGDIIRGLGFVTLYSAYLEEHIDALLSLLGHIEKYGEDKQLCPISRKIKHAKNVLRRIDNHEFLELIPNLDICLSLFEHRNELIHGRIYSNHPREGSILKSGRPNIHDREVNSAELYELANRFDNFRIAIYRPTIFKIPRAINSYLNQQVAKTKTENRRQETENA